MNTSLKTYESSTQKMRAQLPAAALDSDKLEKLSDAEIAQTMKQREEWVLQNSRLAAESLHVNGAVPHVLAWGSDSVARFIAE